MPPKKKPKRVEVRGPKDPVPTGDVEIVYVGGKLENRPKDEWKPEDGIPWYGRKQCCREKRRSGGKRCGAVPTKTGNGLTCRIHGGAVGTGRPISHGLYSTKMHGLGKRFEELRETDSLLDTRDDIALLGTLAEIVLEQGVKFADTPNFRIDAYRIYLAARKAAAKGKDDEFGNEFRKLGNLLRSGYEIGRAMKEAASLSQKRATVAHNERRTRTGEERVITERQFAAFIAVVTSTIIREAPEDVRDRLLNGIDAALVQADAPTPVRVEGG